MDSHISRGEVQQVHNRVHVSFQLGAGYPGSEDGPPNTDRVCIYALGLKRDGYCEGAGLRAVERGCARNRFLTALVIDNWFA